MGLLDAYADPQDASPGFFGTSVMDPRTSGILGLAAGLMQHSPAAGLQAYAAATGPEARLKQALMQTDLASKQLGEKRAQATFDMMMRAYQDEAGGGQASQSPSQPAIPASPGGLLGSGTFGISTGGQPPVSAPQQGGDVSSQLRNLSMQALLGLPGVKERLDILKYRNDPQQVQAGGYSRNPVSGSMTYNPDPVKGITVGPDGKVVAMPGADTAQAAIAGAVTGAQEAAKDPFAPLITVQTPQGPRMMTQAQARAMAGGPQPAPQAVFPSSPVSRSSLIQPGDADQQKIYPDELQKAQDRRQQAQTILSSARTPQDINAATDQMRRANEDIVGIQREMQRLGIGATPAAGGTPANSAASGALPGITLKTPAQEAQDAANADFLKKRAGGAADYETSLNGRVSQGADMNMRLQEQLKALDNFRAGGGGETRAQLAQIAQGIPGISPSIVNGIAGGKLASMQEFNKLAAQTAMEQLKQSMGGAGRISQYEFKVFQNNNPNLSTDPDAIRKIFDFNTRIFGRDLAEQQAFNSHIDSGGNPASFPAQWQQQQATAGYTNPNLTAQKPTAAPLVNPQGWRLHTDAQGNRAYVSPDGKKFEAVK